MPVFSNISEIIPEKPETWEEPLFLTFDIDWAHDEVLDDTIDVVERADVKATWFVTHDTPVLARLRENPKFELAIHPNFNFLLNGDDRQGGTVSEVIDRLLAVVPEAKSVRSHSMTQSSQILELFKQKGLTHDSNHFIPEQIGCALKPWYLWNDIVKVPYFWEDDVACMYPKNTPLDVLKQRTGIKVFDFHPIHVFLNTEHLDRYENSRAYHRDMTMLGSHRFESDTEGTRYLLKLLTGQTA